MPCFTTLADYLEDQCNLVGPGIARIYATEARWIDLFPALDNTDTNTDGMPDTPNTITGDITFDTLTYTGARWAEIELTLRQSSFNSTMEESDGLKSMTTTFEGVLVGNNPKAQYLFHQLTKGRLVIAFPDSTGQIMLIGSKANPASAVMSEEIGADVGSPVRKVLTVTWIHSAPCPYYTGALT